jgi:multiple sugar transport system ATP-binding protein
VNAPAPRAATSSAPTLVLRGVVKHFGPVAALDRVDFEVGASERIVVLGPTGAGKTTLLRTIAGLEIPDSGSIEFSGRDATAMAPSARDVALVFQNFSLYPHLSVRENLEFPLRAPGRALAAAAIKERVEWAAALLRIEKLLARPARHLSGGEMQRVALGRALVRRPKLFLMDEPLTNLDAKLREALRIELLHLFQELKVPVVWVTHDQAEALSMGERVVVLSKGRVLQVGAPREVYLAPASPAVARQLGQPPINLIPVERRAEYWCAADGTKLLAVATVDTRRVGAANRAELGIRPEHVAPIGGRNPAEVAVVEDAGPHRILLLRFAGTEIHVVVRRDFAAAPGGTLTPLLDPVHALLWPAREAQPPG